MLSRKPGFIFATDQDRFNNERGLYYPLESTPFPVAANNDELLENVRNFNMDEYLTKVKDFLQEKQCIEDGSASKKVVDLMEKILAEGKNS